MYYIKFRSIDGVESNISCYKYDVQPQDDWNLITAYIREDGSQFMHPFCVGSVPEDVQEQETAYCSMFVMNINGQTIDKIVSR